MRLLLIEDNGRLGQAITRGLTGDGFVVDWARTLEEAFEARDLARYELVLLDLGLPDGEGLDFVRRIRRERDMTPVLILTARGELGDRVRGLDLGADDYLVKPFEVLELAARCRALLRRPGACLGVVLRAGNVELDTASRMLTARGERVEAQRREIALAEQLLRRVGQVVTKSTLESQLYSLDAEVTPNALEAVVSRLRRHLATAGADVAIRTVHGVGYALLAPKPAEPVHG
jgi:DNA-binding response OmpR family regulator